MSFNSSYEGKIANHYVSGSQRDGSPHHYFQIFTQDGMKKISVTQDEYKYGQEGFYFKKLALSYKRAILKSNNSSDIVFEDEKH